MVGHPTKSSRLRHYLFLVNISIQKIKYFPSRDINDQRTLQSDWTRVLWCITCEAGFSQMYLHRKTEKCKAFHFRLLTDKNFQNHSIIAAVHFGLFLLFKGKQKFFSKIYFCHFLQSLDFCDSAKFQKKLLNGF